MSFLDAIFFAAESMTNKVYFDAEKEHDEQLNKEAINKSRELHEQSLALTKQLLTHEAFVNLEMHFQQLVTDLGGSHRESQRDMFDQMNKNLQNIIITASVLFAALTTVITQGELDNPTEGFLVSYSIVCSLSFLCLFLSIVFSIETLRLLSHFMYFKGINQFMTLNEILNNTNTDKDPENDDDDKDFEAYTQKMKDKLQSYTKVFNKVLDYSRHHESNVTLKPADTAKDLNPDQKQKFSIHRFGKGLKKDSSRGGLKSATKRGQASGGYGGFTATNFGSGGIGGSNNNSSSLTSSSSNSRPPNLHINTNLNKYSAASSASSSSSSTTNSIAADDGEIKTFEIGDKVDVLSEKYIWRPGIIQAVNHGVFPKTYDVFYDKNEGATSDSITGAGNRSNKEISSKNVPEGRIRHRKRYYRFDEYWDEYCNFEDRMARAFLYAGGSLLLIATIIFMWCKYARGAGSSVAAASIAAVFIGISLPVSFLVIRRYNKNFRNLKNELKDNYRLDDLTLVTSDETILGDNNSNSNGISSSSSNNSNSSSSNNNNNSSSSYSNNNSNNNSNNSSYNSSSAGGGDAGIERNLYESD